MRIIDLSQDIYEGMKVYPGHLKTVQFEHATHEETAPRFDGGFSFQTTGFMLNDNGPTHVDSFSHLDPDPAAETIEKMPLDLFYGTAVCLDVTGFPPRTDITAEDLDRIEAVLAGQAAARGTTVEAVRAEVDAQSPLGRMVRAEEVAAACAFLASGGSAAITGEDLNVTAGVVMY